MNSKRWLLVIAMIFGLVLLAGCKKKPVDEKLIKDIAVANLEGLGTEASPYLVTLEKDLQKEFNLVVTADEGASLELDFKILEGESFVSLTGSTNEKLVLKGLGAGEARVLVAAKDKSNVKIFFKIVVTEQVDEIVLVKSIFVPSDGGDGTLASPYLLEVANTVEKTVTFNVSPNNATNKAIDWKLGEIIEGEFVEKTEDLAISLTPEATRITIKGLVSGGSQVIMGSAKDESGIKVFIKVYVTEYTAVSSISISNLLEDETEDYKLVTAAKTNWDMSGEELARKQGLIDGTAGPGAGQAPEDLTYWPSLYKVDVVVGPEEASDPTLLFEYSTSDIIRFNQDGTYEALKAGTTVVTIKSYSNPDVSVTIAVEVKASLYAGILQEAFDNLEVSSLNEWDFDNNPDDLATRPLLIEWQLVQVQTNSKRGEVSADGNQKMFYLGQPNRVYGVALESRVNENQGDINKTTALIWNKVAIYEEATTMEIVVGNNDKIHNEYKIVMVETDGTVHVLKDWTKLLNPNGSSRVMDIEIPTAVKGKTVALAIEQRLGEKENNGELHIKGIWINQFVAVTGVSVDPTEVTISQDSTYQILATVTPTNATNKNLLYSVTPADKGVSVNANGLITVSIDAEVGTYTINIMSVEDPTILTQLTLTVDDNVATTSFSILGFENNQTLNATYDASASGVNNTDIPIDVVAVFNEGASNTGYTHEITGTSIEFVDSKIKFIEVGESTIEFTASGNAELKFKLSFNVVAYSEEGVLSKGINITEALNTVTSKHEIWNTSNLARDWNLKTVDKSHGGSKIAEYGEDDGKMIFEGHATVANLNSAVNIAWNKVHIDSLIKSFKFLVHSHNDDRVLESTSFRVLAIKLGETNEVNELIGWTTVANRWKQKELPFEVSLDVSSYQGEDIILVIEQTGGVQNNGNWPKNSDSGAGAYLHLKGLELSQDEAPELSSLFTHRLYAMTDDKLELAEKWVANAYFYNKNFSNYFGGSYDSEGVYQPLEIHYTGALEGAVGLNLRTTSIYINNSSSDNPMFYPWGLFPALNNSHQNNDVLFELMPTDVVSLNDNVLLPLKEGIATLTVKVKAYNSDTEVIEFPVSIKVEEVESGGGEEPIDEPRTVWNNKGEILEDWKITEGSGFDAGVGEGVDLKVEGEIPGWSSISYSVEITSEISILEFGSRVFVREGETYPHFFVKVNGIVVRAIGAIDDYVYVESDDIITNKYDLSSYIGQTVQIEIGIDRGTHAVITNISLKPFPTFVWDGKAAIAEDWTLTEGSNIDAGVGEGYDLVVGHGDGWSSIEKDVAIIGGHEIFTFGARVFHRDGETYPKFFLKINGVIIRAEGATEDFVYIDTDEVQTSLYNLSSYKGQVITIELGITTGTHAVITKISLDKLTTYEWDGKVAIAEGWTLTDGSNIDAGVGEGYDLVVGHGEGWSSIEKEVTILSGHETFSFGARVFHRDGETYPKFLLKVNGTIITAEGATEDYVVVDTDEVQTNTYDLSAYVGQNVTIELGITTGTHAVITNIKLV